MGPTSAQRKTHCSCSRTARPWRGTSHKPSSAQRRKGPSCGEPPEQREQRGQVMRWPDSDKLLATNPTATATGWLSAPESSRRRNPLYKKDLR
eukprot:2816178-Heterocapsa_arctica.AAC.1